MRFRQCWMVSCLLAVLSMLLSRFGLSGLRRQESGRLCWRCQPANHVMLADKKAELFYFFPFSGWVQPQQSTRGESFYRPIGRRNVKKCPRPWVCVWVRVLSFLRPAACRRSEVTKPSCSPFRYSLSLHVVLTAAWSKPAMFKQISRLRMVVKIKLFINHVEAHNTLNQICWTQITKCSLLKTHKKIGLHVYGKGF